MKRKIRSKSGETLVETLFAMLVVVLAVTMLAGSIVSAAKVNKGTKDLNTAFTMDQTTVITTEQVKITHIDGATVSESSVKAYKSQDDNKNEYCYYEK
ncbi:MAG: hypothetical protein ACI4TF_10635 [Oliverpabstia sp.]